MTENHPCEPVGGKEIAGRLGVRRETVAQWKQRGLLPPARWTVSGEDAWDWRLDVEPWARETGRIPAAQSRCAKEKTMTEITAEARIAEALRFAENGTCDGAHHKDWVIDQMVRALTGCPAVTRSAIDAHGQPYDYEAQGESEAYLRFVRDNPGWNEGIAP